LIARESVVGAGRDGDDAGDAGEHGGRGRGGGAAALPVVVCAPGPDAAVGVERDGELLPGGDLRDVRESRDRGGLRGGAGGRAGLVVVVGSPAPNLTVTKLSSPASA
jgi:hypothetical protein